MNSAFELRGISKRFTRRRLFSFAKDLETTAAVSNVSLCVERGEIAALIGESGCGKTTIANILLLLLQPDCGSIFIDGQDVTEIRGHKNLAPVRKKIQAVFQNSSSSLDPSMTLEQIVTEPLRNYNIPCRSEAERLLELVGLPGQWKKRLPAQLSGGQRQRVAIARAMALQPDVLVLDEPTSSLDVVTTSSIVQLLADLNREHCTSMLFITHDIALAGRFCDTKYVMKDGNILERLHTLDEANASNSYTQHLIHSQMKLPSLAHAR